MKIKYLGDVLFQALAAENIDLMVRNNLYYGQAHQQKKYVLRNSVLSCSMGTRLSRLDMPSDHGIVPPVTLTSDCVAHTNIHSFGSCKCAKAPGLPDRVLESSGYKCNPILATDWQQDSTTARIWNEKMGKYEDAVNVAATLVCLYGGIITVAEVPKKVPFVKPTILLCLHGNKIALVDMLHPKSQTVIDESTIIANIDDEGVVLAEEPNSINTDMVMSLYSVDTADDGNGLEPLGDGLKDVADDMEGRDPISIQGTGVSYALDKVDDARADGKIPYGNEMTDLAETYLRAGGDYAGVLLGTLWAFGLTLDTSQEKKDSLKQAGVFHTEKLGEIEFDGNGFWWKSMLSNMLIPLTEVYNVDWKTYMETNPILTGKVGDVVIPIGYSLDTGESKKISMKISMIIENGSGYTAYEFLHGTVDNVGGFQINGTVSKNKKGDITYKMDYAWNDILNPEIDTYIDDKERAEVANKYLNPKDYIIHITWSETTKIIAKPGTFTKSSGWLKNWSDDWNLTLDEKYDKLYNQNEDQQKSPALGGLGWPERLKQIKEQYSSYYN